MKVLICDDHSIVRTGLKQILQNLKMFDEIEEVDEGQAALNKIRDGNFDLVILDISMPGLSGLEILQTLKDFGIEKNILVLSVHSEHQYAIRTLRLGAKGYLSKNSAHDELELAIKRLSAGKKNVSSEIAEKFAFEKPSIKNRQLHELLTEREFLIFCQLAEGTPIVEIARKLSVSEKTVSSHRARILKKMEMNKNAELTIYAIHNSLI